MIRFNAAPAFDFDEWLVLRRVEPAAFDARCRTLRAIEIARSGCHGGLVHEALDRLDASMENRSAAQRADTARQALAEATRELSVQLEILSRQRRRGGSPAITHPAA